MTRFLSLTATPRTAMGCWARRGAGFLSRLVASAVLMAVCLSPAASIARADTSVTASAAEPAATIFGVGARSAATTPPANTRTDAERARTGPRTAAGSSTSQTGRFRAPKAGTGAISKPPAGRGSVPSADRDPRRLYPRSEVQKGLDEQGGLCARGKNPIDDLADARGHHRKRSR